MRFRSNLLGATVLAMGLSLAAAGGAEARATIDGAPALVNKSAAASNAKAIKVAGRRWRRRGYGRGYRRGRRRGFAKGVAVGVGAAIVGAIILNQAAQARRRPPPPNAYIDDAFDACAAKYRSFRYSDGTFQPYGGGLRRLCPYLQ